MEKYIIFVLLWIAVVSNSGAQSKTTTVSKKEYTMLCLGDSYTIGEAVSETERFPNQTIALLAKQGHAFASPHIIAKTGWTTDELKQAIADEKLTGTYDYVTLLIGVNNQYRDYEIATYRKEFKELLATAIGYAHGNTASVFVLSIPDWGATPFGANDAKKRSPALISAAINSYNAISKEECLKQKVHYINITPISRKTPADGALLTNDNLHPSGKMYHEWAVLLAKEITPVLK